PLVSKVCDIRMVQIATEIMTEEFTGKPSSLASLKEKKFSHYGVKEAVFPFNMFPEVDPLLGPEMRSTGEVLGMASNFGEAFFKAQEATKTILPLSGTVLISVNDRDKADVVEIAKGFADLGFKLIATGGTCDLITKAGIECKPIHKLQQGRPNVLDAITNKEVDIAINSPVGNKKGADDDSYIRKAAIKARISYVTTMAAAKATVEGIKARKKEESVLKSLQEFHKEIQ
ncbi:MAG: carbamoyl phosphate synthase large subunit, partial [Clostridium sp.]|nr:carbamoyl phosphate synthase large subunit [Clostridium sp.]